MRLFAFLPRLLIVTAFLISTGAAVSSGAPATTEGCMSQWLFNGVWRVQVVKVEPYMDGAQVGWQVTEVWRNGASQEIAPGDSLLKDQVLNLDDGSTIAASSTNAGTMSMGVVANHSFAQAAQFTYVQYFRTATFNAAAKPKVLAITFDGARLAQYKARPQFTTAQYNFRIKLDCTAGGGQTAQGGSFEIPAVQGCLNQWMSNGVWRMRATAVGPDNDTGSMLGWKVSEDWMSLAHVPIAPADTNVTMQQLVLQNGDTVSSDSGVVSSGSFNEMALRTFAPGGSFTYQQAYRIVPIDPQNKPVKLIVTFDAAKEKLASNRPQYTVNPPNFRISFACTK